MKKPICSRIPKARFQIDGFMKDYLHGVTEQWLLVAPRANPAMLEMFRDRDASPLREMVPWAGEFAGKYLTAAVQVLRVTGDPRLKAWLRQFVSRLVGLQDRDGYLGPWPRGCRLTNVNSAGVGTWDTWGHYHAMLGVMLWHEQTGDKAALACAAGIGDLLCRKYLGKKRPRLVETGWAEMNLAPVHSLCILYRKTKQQRYLKLALQIVEEFSARSKGKPLAGDYLRQALQGREFFQMPQHRWESLHPIMALAELYWITGQDQYRRAFERIWWSIVKLDRHNNGGFCSWEQAYGDRYNFGTIETCCTIAWTAMSVEMLKLTGNSIVADELELTTLNSIVGMHSSTGRWATYDTPMNGLRRAQTCDATANSFREGSPELSCCSVNAPRGFGMISDWALMKDNEGLVLNYYGPSAMAAKVKPGLSVTLTQETRYPIAGRIVIKVKPSKAAEFTLKLRIPHWSSRTKVRLNGKSIGPVQAGRYARISRTWKPNDTIEIDLDMSLHFHVGQGKCKGLTCIHRGPVLLAYDHRYNLHNAPKKKVIRDSENWKIRDPAHWKLTDPKLRPPAIDARNIKPRVVTWDDWMPPALLVEFKVAGGKTVRLCDFGSAGEAGTPYLSWLPVRHAPPAPGFSRDNPLRTSRI